MTTTPRVIDFDAYRAERDQTPLTLRVGGRDFQLPSEMPASLALEVMRLHEDGWDETDSASLPPGELQKLGAAVFGGEAQFLEILAQGMVTLNELPELIERVIGVYGETLPSPNRATRRKTKRRSPSSPTGR